MDDNQIVALYWSRSEQAIQETQQKYGKYCYTIAYQILYSREDADEAVNDTYLGAWNGMPPHRPAVLSGFLGKLTRRISIDKWRNHKAEKRGGGELPVALDELSDCIPSSSNPEREAEMYELTAVINTFLWKLPKTERKIFVCRYWYLDSIAAICERFGFSHSKVKSMLARTRKKLRVYLEKAGVFYEG